MIDVRDLCFSYGQTPVLRHVSFRIGRGERAVLLGRSGLGKTTLLHLLCGLLQPEQGTIHVPARLGVVFQEDRLIPGLTAADNIRLVCPGLPETELAALAGSLELTPYLGQRPAALSGGQKRRMNPSKVWTRPSGSRLPAALPGVWQAAPCCSSPMTRKTPPCWVRACCVWKS